MIRYLKSLLQIAVDAGVIFPGQGKTNESHEFLRDLEDTFSSCDSSNLRDVCRIAENWDVLVNQMHSIWQHRAIRKRRILQWFIYEITESETPVLKNSCSSWLGLWWFSYFFWGFSWEIVLYTFFILKKPTCFFILRQSIYTDSNKTGNTNSKLFI